MSVPDPIDESFNPYQAPKSQTHPSESDAIGSAVLDIELAQAERRMHLADEATLKTIGLVFYLMAGFSAINLAIALFSPTMTERLLAQTKGVGASPGSLKTMMIVSGLFGVLLNFLLGHQLRQFKDGARVLIIIIYGLAVVGGIISLLGPMSKSLTRSAIGLSAAGMILNGWIVYFLIAHEAKLICSPRYRQIIAKTPEIQPVMGMRDRVLVVAIVLLGAAGFVNSYL